MSIDYDRLRELVRVVENYGDYEPREVNAAADQLKHASLDATRELLRLHDGLQKTVESKRAVAERMRTRIRAGRLPNYLGYAAAMLEVTCDELDSFLEGDTNE